MADRYYVPELARLAHGDQLRGRRIALSPTESHHLLHVMRVQIGQSVTLFDGQGGQYAARVQELKRKSCVVELESMEVEMSDTNRLSNTQPSPSELSRLTLAIALPKGDRQQWLVEKATELNVARLICWTTRRSVVRVREKSLEKLRRSVIAACKQSGRNRLMDLAAPCHFRDIVQSNVDGCRLLAVTASRQPTLPLTTAMADCCTTTQCTVGIGPEGGWSEDEVELAVERGWQPVSLGPLTLRTETAAIAVAAAFALKLGTYREETS